MVSTSGSLMDRLNNKAEQDRQQMETLLQTQFQTLSKNLQSASENALNTTGNAIAKQVSTLEQNLISQCQKLENLFNPLNVRMLKWSCLLMVVFALCLCSLIGIFRYLATDLRQEMAELRHERNVLEENYARVWRQFKGLEAYEAGGKHYLLTKLGWKIRLAGIAEDRNANAWEIVREQ